MTVKQIKIVDIPTSNTINFDTKVLAVDPSSQITRLLRTGDFLDYVSELAQNTANMAIMIANTANSSVANLSITTNIIYELANTTANVANYANTTAEYANTTANYANTTAEYANTTANYANNIIANLPYGIIGYYPGTPSSNTITTLYIAAWDMSFSANLQGSKATCLTTSTANTDFSILKNGTQVASFRYIAGYNEAIFLESNDFTLNTNDVIQVKAPEVPDNTLSDIAYTLVGIR